MQSCVQACVRLYVFVVSPHRRARRFTVARDVVELLARVCVFVAPDWSGCAMHRLLPWLSWWALDLEVQESDSSDWYPL